MKQAVNVRNAQITVNQQYALTVGGHDDSQIGCGGAFAFGSIGRGDDQYVDIAVKCGKFDIGP